MKQLEAYEPGKSFFRKYRIPFIIAVLVILAVGSFKFFRPTASQQFIAKTESKNKQNTNIVSIEGSVTLSAAEVIKANIRTVAVEHREMFKDIQATGTIKIAEPNEHVISSRTRGRIERLYVSATGKVVRKGDPLYDYYSPDLLIAEQEYLIAKSTHTAGAKNDEEHDHHYMDAGLIRADKERLQLYGLSKTQIAELENKGVPRSSITVISPASGVVLQKLVQEGAYVDEGTSLFQLADLSVVWAEIEVPESYIRFIHDGFPVSITTTAYPSDKFQGKVIFISPVENPESRSITVRLQLQNSKGKLRPEMFVSADIKISMGNSLSVPASAVIRTGLKDYLWIRNSDGSFSSRNVTLGSLSQDNEYQVLAGITEGEEVASTGSFLIDSEHQLASGSNPMAGMNMDEGNEKSKTSGEGTGIVRSIDIKQQMITINHGVIQGVMSAMTMGYKVSDPSLLQRVKSGDDVTFTLSRSENGEYVITAIAPK